MILMNGILVACKDLELRLHHCAQMQAAGLHGILEALRSFGHLPLDKLLKIFQQTLDKDMEELRERFDRETLENFGSPEDVLKALQAKTKGLKANDYLLSTLQHLLLIQEDGPALTRYYQLIDSIVADVVLDKKLAGAENRLGQSVERIIARFDEADRLQAEGADGLVETLKEQITQLEERLRVYRDRISVIEERRETQKAGHAEQIALLEAQTMELFRMLKEVKKGVGEEVFNAIQAEAGGSEIQRRVDEMDKARLSAFHPSYPKPNVNCSASRIPLYRVAID